MLAAQLQGTHVARRREASDPALAYLPPVAANGDAYAYVYVPGPQGGETVISYEEYHPYGTTAYRAANSQVEVSARRYRYTGKEKDEETGLYYHGARYYAPWLGRWTAADPAGLEDGNNRFRYVGDNPITFQDSGGTRKEPSAVARLAIGVGRVVATGVTGDPDAAEKLTNAASGGIAQRQSERQSAPQEVRAEGATARSGEDRRGQYRAQQASRTTTQRAVDAYSGVVRKGIAAPLHGVGTGLGENAGAILMEAGDVLQAGREGRLGSELYEKGSEVVSSVVDDVRTAAGTYMDVPSRLAEGDASGAGSRFVEGAGAAIRVAGAIITAGESGIAQKAAGRLRPKGRGVDPLSQVDDIVRSAEGRSPPGTAGAMRRLVYEASPKHGPTQVGDIGALPKNGQAALDTAVDLGPTTPRRVGIDYDAGDFVVFDQTVAGEFHGHVRAWKQLDQRMQSALRNAGMASKKGKILRD